MTIIEIDNLKFSYLGQTETALEIEHLSISEGESVLITGKSGSGKSTLIQCINGIIPHVTAGMNDTVEKRMLAQFTKPP